MKTTKENIVATPLDFHLLYKQTAPYILSGVLQLLADKLDARVLLCNSSILFFGKEEENSNNNNNNNNDKWLFSEYNLPQHVHSQWITSCQQSLLSGSKVKFTYTVGDFMFKVRVGVTKMDEPDCLWYCAKRKKSNSYSLPMTKNLRESELRLVLDLMPSLVWCAKDSEVIYGNQMWLNYGGTIGASKTEEEDIKQHWGNICHPDDFAWSWERWQTSTKEREHFEGQVRIKKGDDDYRWFKMVTVPIQGEKNENKWVGVCTDIHDQKLQEAQAIIDKTISNFLAMMSHEMRTPLTGITGLLQWLIGTSLSPEQLDCCSTISICTDSLLVMINNLLDILKLEGGKVELVCNEMNPVKITEICVDMFSRLAEPKKIEMIYNIDVDMVDLVISDSYRYQQVLTNLLSNAVKFTHEGGEIEVSLKILSEEEATDFVKDLKHDVIDTLFDNTQWLQFSVRDTGKGIEKEKLPTIFRRFSQVEASLKTENQGGGLGLAICRNIATLMNGSVTAVSEPDKGSHFYFTIPVGVSANASPVFGPPPISIPSHPCSIILVNNPTLYDVFQRKLEHYSLEVITLEEYKKRTGEAWLKLPMQGYKLDKNFIWKGGKARRMSGKGSWSDLTTIVEETIEENYNKSDNGNNNNNNNNSNNNSTNSKNNNNNNDDRQLRKSASDSATLKNKYNPCIVFIDQLLWHETDSSTRDWLKKNSKICVVRMGCKDITYEDGTRSLIKPVKDHMLYAECDIFLRSCELPKQPIVPSELSRSRDASLESLGIQFPLKVMVADDSTVNLQVAGKLLQKIGYKTISTCVNGSLVLEYFANNGPVEVVLMDMQMPGLDGCEATILLRQQYPTTVIHVIGFTATSFTEDREKCLSSGMCSFLSKPVKLSELEAELIKAWRAVNLRIPCNCNKHLELNRSETT